MAPAIFDVSALLPKLPDHSVADYDLGPTAELPGGTNIFLHFGRQQKLMVMEEIGLHFEGAYVEQRGDKGDMSFGIHLVCNWPSEQSNSVRVWFHPGQTVKGNVEKCADLQSYWTDPVLVENNKAVNAALNSTIKSLLYLGSPEPDIQLGRSDNGLVVQTVGRNIDPIRYLPQPVDEEILANFKI
ncbi:hypothetical protein [Rhizobium sp. Rhizsp42]|uniref:hypothetical protein n=1 Tax=Rhizobium sp. Rhizsp42 TaxID=3243034 RepID=UPI0039AF0217